ncbi:MAG: T9SS type A sorting domain-containing protein [Bacteroidota bacterium]|nr:T9SS type A sorting domain-containing protein [Bacteroidota bacterium]
MKRLLLISIFLSLWLASNNAFAQEVEIGLQENPAILKYIRENPDILTKSTNQADTLELPFFDDFSSYTVFPADTIWADKDVYINNGYPVHPPSIGVATFDAINSAGALHPTASSTQFLADKLTSLPINLENYTADDSLYISFYYQPKGTADSPEESDSLVLEYYAPETDEWHWTWSTTGSLFHNFKSVILPVPFDTLFYQKGFQFRFKNYASLTGLYEASWASNADQWHIDYVYLDTGRTSSDTILTDLAFISGPTYFLRDYTSMPWRHFVVDNSQMVDSYSFTFANHRTNTISIIREIEIYDLITGDPPVELIGGGGASDNFGPGDTTITHNLNYTFSTATSDNAKFLVQAYLKPGEIVADFSQSNDTAGYVQIFDDYYAHDDGSPESGYGLSGEGTQNAMLAYKFLNYYVDDSLRAIDMYFNRTIGDASQKYFFLRIWEHNSNTGLPGDLLYDQIGVIPEYHDSLFRFHRYILQGSLEQDTAILVPDTFYVGWKQTTTDLLNIGFDKNRIPRDTSVTNWRNPWIFYNVTGGWQNSSLNGALMIRPVFSEQALVAIPEINKKSAVLSVYPNPSSGLFTIDLSDEKNPRSSRLEVFSSTGQLVLSKQISEEKTQLDMRPFSVGIYFVKVTDRNEIIRQGKIMVIR